MDIIQPVFTFICVVKCLVCKKRHDNEDMLDGLCFYHGMCNLSGHWLYCKDNEKCKKKCEESYVKFCIKNWLVPLVKNPYPKIEQINIPRSHGGKSLAKMEYFYFSSKSPHKMKVKCTWNEKNGDIIYPYKKDVYFEDIINMNDLSEPELEIENIKLWNKSLEGKIYLNKIYRNFGLDF